MGGSGLGAQSREVWSQTLPPLPKGVSGERKGCNPQEGAYSCHLKPLHSINTFIEHLLCALRSSSLGSPSEYNVKMSQLFAELLFLVTGNQSRSCEHL